jgi:hypothetical protein
MFGIRISTPSLADDSGSPYAAAELNAGGARVHFQADLRFWSPRQYERQWADGIRRLVRGATSSALMSAFTGARGELHRMWALWRRGGHIYVQPHCVVRADLSGSFDPAAPYDHVGEHVPMTLADLPHEEWRVELAAFLEAAVVVISAQCSGLSAQ